jgi:aldose 1-epimerase
MAHTHIYGSMPDGTPVRQFVLSNALGVEIRCIEYGATTTDVLVPDRNGLQKNVILGYGNLDDYLAGTMFFGATAGRVAGRISGASFTLEGTEFALDVNDPPNCLHGGSHALDTRVWSGEIVEDAEGEAVEFRYTSPDGDNGFPGTVTVYARFVVARDVPKIILRYDATTDRRTPLNIMNHCYFNLGGDDLQTIDDHLFSIDADRYTPAGENMGLLGRVDPVDGRPEDVRSMTRMGDVIPHLHNRHGDNYVLRRKIGDRRLLHASAAYSPESGIALSIDTTTDCMQFFGGQYITAEPVSRTGRPYLPRAGFCLECQDYPDAVHSPHLSGPLTSPDRPYSQKTIWTFATR